MKLQSTWPRVVRSPIPKRGEAYIIDGRQFEDGLYRIVVGYGVAPETVAEMEAAIEDRARVQRLVMVVNGLLAGEPEYEYGFYDSADPLDPAKVWTHCFGLPFKDAEQAKRTGDKNVWGQTVIVRRKIGTEQWEIVP